MDVQEKRQELSNQADQRAAMLKAMGIGQWYQRGAAVVTPAPTTVEPMQTPEHSEVAETAHPAAALASAKSLLAQERPPAATHAAEKQEAQAPLAVASDSVTTTVEIIEFCWIKGQTGMLACSFGADRAMRQYLQDIVVFADWARGQSGALSHGEFRWPQLLETGGTPTRALSVFFDKHFPAGNAWVALAGEVSPFMSKWLSELPVTAIELPQMQQSIAATATKKAIWQCLIPNK